MLEANSWVFAKTMPENPHYYTLRKHWEYDSEFWHCVEYANRNGYGQNYKGRKYTIIDVNDHFYWTMSNSFTETILINRKVHDTSHPYDAIAESYKEMFANPEYVHEERNIFSKYCNIAPYAHVLEIGSGTGNLYQYLSDEYYNFEYQGIDASSEMVRVANETVVGLHTKPFMHCRLQGFVPPAYDGIEQRYDLITAMFGVPNYLSKVEIHRIPYLLYQGGEAVLMFYKPDYVPVTYRVLDNYIGHVKYSMEDVLSMLTTSFTKVVVDETENYWIAKVQSI
jgi:SAM-dependent methyltransferase